MTDEKFQISIPAGPGLAGTPSIEANFGRVTVLLGANGTGKSKALQLLRGMSSNFGGEPRPVVYIEGGRVVPLAASLEHNNQTYVEFGTIEVAEQTFRNRRFNPLPTRVKDALFLLKARGEGLKARHSDDVEAWQKRGGPGPCPSRDEDPLQQLFEMFHEVFPEIKIRILDRQKHLFAKKGNDGANC